jgi:hypothetical protein
MRLLATDAGPLPIRLLRWTARAASLVSLAFLAMFATSGGAAPTAAEWLLLAFFPIGVALGMIVAWHREILGGVIAASSLAAFHALLLLDGSRPAPGWWFLVFASPALAVFPSGPLTACVGVRRARPAPGGSSLPVQARTSPGR